MKSSIFVMLAPALVSAWALPAQAGIYCWQKEVICNFRDCHGAEKVLVGEFCSDDSPARSDQEILKMGIRAAADARGGSCEVNEESCGVSPGPFGKYRRE